MFAHHSIHTATRHIPPSQDHQPLKHPHTTHPVSKKHDARAVLVPQACRRVFLCGRRHGAVHDQDRLLQDVSCWGCRGTLCWRGVGVSSVSTRAAVLAFRGGDLGLMALWCCIEKWMNAPINQLHQQPAPDCFLHRTPHPQKPSSVTEAEAQKWEEHREERQERAARLKQQLLLQYKQRGQAPPPEVLGGSSSSSPGTAAAEPQ